MAWLRDKQLCQTGKELKMSIAGVDYRLEYIFDRFERFY